MTKQETEKFEKLLLERASESLLNEIVEETDMYINNWLFSDKCTVRDVRKYAIENTIRDESIIRFAKDLNENIEDLKLLKNLVERKNLEIEDFKNQINDRITIVKTIKRASEPILEKEFLKFKPKMSEKVIEEYKKELKGWKFITK